MSRTSPESIAANLDRMRSLTAQRKNHRLKRHDGQENAYAVHCPSCATILRLRSKHSSIEFTRFMTDDELVSFVMAEKDRVYALQMAKDFHNMLIKRGEPLHDPIVMKLNEIITELEGKSNA